MYSISTPTKSLFRYVWAEPIRSKSKDDYIRAFDILLKKTGKWEEISSDGELGFLEDYFAHKSIVLSTKPGRHCSLVENAIGRIKRRLYAQMLFQKNSKWTTMLTSAIKNINQSNIKGTFTIFKAF